jgi:16S rRNA (cytidine1402-2'-O)-methyltransferase
LDFKTFHCDIFYPGLEDCAIDHSMALFVVATPIGNAQDFSLRALDILKTADLIIGEELKVLRQTLKAAGVRDTPLEQLNEHSTAEDIAHFVGECQTKNVALVSDCGTPGFCDPGADLVAACANAGVSVRPAPGPSSLMTLLSVCGVRVEQFLFYGFLPAKTELREAALATLKRETRPFIVMETPYRSQRLVEDLARNFPNHHCVLGLDLTGENEKIIRGAARDLLKAGEMADREPIALLIPRTP